MSERIFPIGPSSGGKNVEPEQGSAESPGVAHSENQTARSAESVLEQRKKGVPLIWIPVLICLGLLIAAGYLGRRIFSSRHSATTLQATRPIKRATVVEAPVEQAPVEQAPVQQTSAHIEPVAPAAASPLQAPDAGSSSAETPVIEDFTLITPEPGERYIQISALNTEAARKYVAQLRRGPLEPHVAPGPRPGIVRILIGPFHDNATLMATRGDLLAAGIACFVREY